MLADRMRMGGRRPIQWVGYSWNGTASNTDYTISFNAEANDLIVLAYGFGTATSGAHTFAVPSGYTKMVDMYLGNTNNINGCVAYQKTTVARSSVTIPGCGVSSVQQVGVALVFRNVNETNPFYTTVLSWQSGYNLNIMPPAATPTKAGSWIVPIGFRAGKDDTTFMGYSPPSDLSDPFGVAAGAGLGNQSPPLTGIYGGSYRSWTSGTYTPATWNAAYSTSIGGYVATTLIIQPI